MIEKSPIKIKSRIKRNIVNMMNEICVKKVIFKKLKFKTVIKEVI